MGDEIVSRCRKIERGVQRIIVFTEFFGSNSFAGAHLLEDVKELRLFDVNLYKRGIMEPRLFLDTFGDLPFVAKMVYQGSLNSKFIDDVHDGKYPVWEGVVAKWNDRPSPGMAKIKTFAYLQKLKEVFRDGYAKFWE